LLRGSIKDADTDMGGLQGFGFYYIGFGGAGNLLFN
jgi:hypothetical protein